MATRTPKIVEPRLAFATSQTTLQSVSATPKCQQFQLPTLVRKSELLAPNAKKKSLQAEAKRA
jgi:hypothetical protein